MEYKNVLAKTWKPCHRHYRCEPSFSIVLCHLTLISSSYKLNSVLNPPLTPPGPGASRWAPPLHVLLKADPCLGGDVADGRTFFSLRFFFPFLNTVITQFSYLKIIVDLFLSKLTELCMFLLSSSPTSLMVLILRQVPRKVRYRLLSCPQWVVLYRIFDPDRIDWLT